MCEGTVTLKFKRVFNKAHNRLQDTFFPLRFQSASDPNMSSNRSGTDQALSQRLSLLCEEFNTFFEHIKFAILIPLGWWWTLWHFVIVLTWDILTLPLRITINFYEKQVRRAFPWLPSIWGTLALLFPQGIKLPTLTSLTAGPYKGAGPSGPELPTLDITADLDTILNGDSDAPSEVESSRSKLASALKNIPASSSNDFNARLESVKEDRIGGN
ncbi:hypothetical protein BJV74DRAFT_187322 [Russula compacta]|nr:hypothetical protein BJV74DRAFT_187322 [Russula compacta]